MGKYPGREVDPDLWDDLKSEIMAGLEAYLEQPAVDRYGRYRRKRPGAGVGRAKAGLKRELAREIRALQAVEQRAGRARHPLVREMLKELWEEARELGLTADDLARVISRPHGPGPGGLLSWPGLGQGRNIWPFLLVALLALLLLPAAGQNIRPLARKVIAAAADLTERMNQLAATVKEGLEDIMAEAQFSRLSGAMEAETAPKT